MSSVDEDQSSQPSSDGGVVVDDLKSATNHDLKVNGLNEDSIGSANESGEGIVRPKENGLVNHVKDKDKHGSGHQHSSSKSSGSDKDKHHSSSSSKHKEGSSSSSKHGTSSSSSKSKESSKHKDGHSSSSSSKHREGSSSQHSSSRHKEGSSSSSSHKDKDKSSSSSSKPKDSSSSSSLPDKHSSSSSKHKDSSSSSSKHKDGHSSSSSKAKDSSSKDKSSSSSSADKPKDASREKSSSSSDRHKDKSKENKDKSKSSSKQREEEKHASSEKDKLKTKGDNNQDKGTHSVSKNKDTLKHIKEEVQIKSEIMDVKSEDYSDVKVTVKKEASLSPVKSERQSVSPVKKPAIKSEEESEDDDKPLSVRKKESKPVKRPKEESDYEEEYNEEDEDSDVPLSVRNKAKKLKTEKKVVKKVPVVESPKKATQAPKKKAVKNKKEIKEETEDQPVKKKKKDDEEHEVWRWWEEQREDSSVKWTYLEHKGPVFAPAYEPLPKNVRFYYDGKPMELTRDTEEVAVFYGRMLDHEYTTRDVFNNNFMKDWRKVMTAVEKTKITDLKKCNFHEILDHFKKKTEERKAMSKEEKQKLKKDNEEIVKQYGFCIIDNHKEKIGNFRIEPPSLFRGRGDHPKQGMLKKRINPEDVIINCSKDSKIPVPPAGRKWKEVRHDNSVTWLASWTESIQGATKYVMLNAASKLKGEKDWQKYETARKLHKCVDKIRAQYQEDWKSKEMRVRQRAVALYFIDKLALRAGNEKEEGETADTVGCCSLRVEHIKLHNEKDGKQYVVEFDFLGKDSIRYQNSIPVEKRVFKNVQLFMENKQPEDDLFDRLNTTILNKHLQDLMEGLTAKVFRTFNASKTLSEQLELLTNPDDTPAAKMLSYNRANRAVAILCNHQRSVPKTFEKSMENLMKKIDSKKDEIKEVKKEIKGIKADYKKEKSVRTKTLYEKKKKTLMRLEDQLTKLEVQATDKDENKEIALGTSKLNYLDPRISVAWCKKFDIPLEKVYNKTLRDKFRWAIDMADQHFKF